MKKIIYPLMLLVTLTFNLNFAVAADNKPKTELTAEQKVELNRITSRVEEIRAMDKSNLSRAEKKELRKELKEMKKKANAIGGGGVYLSVGAIIIIILLLILIL